MQPVSIHFTNVTSYVFQRNQLIAEEQRLKEEAARLEAMLRALDED